VTDSLAARGISANQKSYVCIEVFQGERVVLLVSRPDGDWCFLCGADHPEDAASFRVVGIGHAISEDSSLSDVLDLDVDEEAERSAVGGAWTRTRF
jgi:hypothetical protein